MTLNTSKKLGRAIADLSNKSSQLASNITPDDPSAVFPIVWSEDVSVTGTVRIYQHDISTTAFVLDHPVNGELDSTLFELDGGYAGPRSLLTTITL